MTELVIQQKLQLHSCNVSLLHHTLHTEKTAVVLGFVFFCRIVFKVGFKSRDRVCMLYCFSSNINPFLATPPQMKATPVLSEALKEMAESNPPLFTLL